MPSVEETRKFYQKEFQYPTGLTNEKLIRKRGRIILENLKKISPNGKTLLDVGSGYGYFLDEANKLDIRGMGIEPSRQLYRYSQKHYQVEVINTDLEGYSQSKFKKGKFDFITIIHTIEHVAHPEKMIRRALRLLVKNGILFIETPNVNSHLFYVLKSSYDFLTPPDHKWLFSKKSFQAMLKDKTDLKIERVSTYSYPEHFMGILKRLIKGDKKISRPVAKKTGDFVGKDLSLNKKIKIRLFDKGIAYLAHPLLNLFDKGSILELYLMKIS